MFKDGSFPAKDSLEQKILRFFDWTHHSTPAAEECHKAQLREQIR
jgi:hypothetical protein